MNATYEFHAMMTAHPGKGDELDDILLRATTSTGPATSENCVFYLVGRSASNKDVVHVSEAGPRWRRAPRISLANRLRCFSQGLQRSLARRLNIKTKCPLAASFTVELLP